MSDTISNENLGNDPNLIKRVSGIVATGGIPASIISFCGDLFTPSGGWIVVGIIGILAIIIGGCLIVSLFNLTKASRLPWWYRLTSADKELTWIWKAKSPFLAHGVHVVIFFGLVCLVIAQKSFATASKGGILADNVSAIAVAQRQLGISEKMLAEQEKTTVAIEILSSKADNFKREISNDPRIQLADKGVLWEGFRLTQAIRSNDKSTVDLFLKGKMPIAVADALAGFKSSDEELKTMLITHHQLFNPADCRLFLGGLDASTVQVADSTSANMARSFCRDDKAKEYVKQELEEKNRSHQKQLAAYNEALSKIKSPDECVKHELRDNGRPLIQEASMFSPLSVQTMGLRQQMLSNINSGIIVGRTDVRSEVRKYCETQATQKPNISTDDRIVQKWKLLQKWLG